LDNLASQAGGNSIPSISYDSNNAITTISNIVKVNTLKFNDNSEQTTSFTTNINNDINQAVSDISTLDTRVNSCENNISLNTTSINNKMDKFDDINKISISYIDYSTSQLNYVDAGITQNISTSLTNLSSSLSALQTSDQTQTTSITNMTSSINDLTNNKEDLISDSNLLNSLYVSYNATTVKSTLDSMATSISNKADTTTLSSYAPLSNPTFTGFINGITKSMVGLSNVDNTSDVNKSISTLTQTALNLKADTTTLSSYAPLSNPTFTNYIQTPRIFEQISNAYSSFTSNILTFDYGQGSILYFDGLTSATNFTMVLNSMNPNSQTNKSFTFSLILNTATYKAYANLFRLGATSYTLIASGGLANTLINATSQTVIQSFTIVYTSSSTVPYKIFTNVSSYF
jgi:hypothetical protein